MKGQVHTAVSGERNQALGRLGRDMLGTQQRCLGRNLRQVTQKPQLFSEIPSLLQADWTWRGAGESRELCLWLREATARLRAPGEGLFMVRGLNKGGQYHSCGLSESPVIHLFHSILLWKVSKRK